MKMKSMRRERSADMSDDLNTVSTATGKVSVNGIPVPDDLRTRIATVIRREVPCHPPAADRIADAVIRELKLEPEYRFFPNDPPLARYVTEWEKADDE